ncbi:DUF4112 domain-containing protein [Leisingera methylohalidivorans]|uniref:DUF4112 domain-containing protein n=1 Tax=Leisingera methylohalidivorans DSM 14336 TaxID=999552 RepID=V9VSR7_9RHOB|nr:DUF4112 domain-containing protein [Leisingera methylohalidivorans]AHD01078.1 hypothetical protein METH_10645 [Leisingera methylohalidivorans DSM 14336]
MPKAALHEDQLRSLESLAHRMDRAFRIPLIGTRVGWDSILGLVPGAGDAIALLPAGYILLSGHRMGASKGTLARMAANIGIDTLVGAIPLIGDLFDIGWKANVRNVALLRRHLKHTAAQDEALAKRLARRSDSNRTAPRQATAVHPHRRDIERSTRPQS